MLRCKPPAAAQLFPEEAFQEAGPEHLNQLETNPLFLRVLQSLLRKWAQLALEKSSSENEIIRNAYQAQGAKEMLEVIEGELRKARHGDRESTTEE